MQVEVGKVSHTKRLVCFVEFKGLSSITLHCFSSFYFSFVKALTQQRASQCSVCHHPCLACFLGLS